MRPMLHIRPHEQRPGYYLLEAEQLLPQPLDRVFEFFSDAGNLETLTPAFLNFHILTPRPVPMFPGSMIDYRLRLHGIPFRWRSEISVWEPPFRFVDRQITGPYRDWHHEHSFAEVPGGTLARDRVEYAVPGGPLAPLVHRWFVRPDVERIFLFRRQRMTELFGAATEHTAGASPTVTQSA